MAIETKQPTISRRELFKALKYEPHSAEQWDAHESTERFKIPCCGRRWGKTTFAGNDLSYYMFTPDAYYWIVGPSYALGEKEFRVVYNNMVSKLKLRGTKGFKATYNVKQGDMRIEMPWNTILEVKSAERQDSLLGEGLDGVIMSEAARHTMQTWQQYIEPALSDKRGWAIFPSTPRGYNWYQGMWMMGQDPSFTDVKSWRFPSWSNPVVFPGGEKDEEIVRIKAVASRAYFAQEYAAEFTAFEGQIYEEFDPAVHVKEIKYRPDWINCWTFDFGFKDPFVCLDVMVAPDDSVWIWREYMVSGMSTYEHGKALLERSNPENFHVDRAFADPRGADAIATLVRILNKGIEAPNVPWSNGIETVQRWMKIDDNENTKFHIDPSCTNTIRQLGQLRHKEQKEGVNVRVEGQHDYDDHGPDAVRYFFGPYFFLRVGGNLSDVYGTGGGDTEASAFFRLHQGFTQDPENTFRI